MVLKCVGFVGDGGWVTCLFCSLQPPTAQSKAVEPRLGVETEANLREMLQPTWDVKHSSKASLTRRNGKLQV